MERYKSKYKGETLFLIGDDTHLDTQDQSFLKNEYTFGFNKVFKFFTPTFYIVEDPLFAKENQTEISSLKGTVNFFGKYLQPLIGEVPNTHWLNVYYDYAPYPGFPHFSKNAAEILWVGGGSIYLCLQIAYFMGFDTLYLLGFKADGLPVLSPDSEINYDKPLTLSFQKAKKQFILRGARIELLETLRGGVRGHNQTEFFH